jgi:hypothetical protein
VYVPKSGINSHTRGFKTMQVDVPWKTALHEKGERPPDWFRKELKLSEGKVASLTSRPPKERKNDIHVAFRVHLSIKFLFEGAVRK